jgi:hypothetical protein
MTHYIEYELEDGTKVMVEGEEPAGGVVRASRSSEATKSKIGFKEAFAGARASIREVIAEFEDLHVYEAEIKFGMKSTGEAGIFAIGKVGGEMNYEVTLKWKKPEKKPTKTAAKPSKPE